MAQYTHIIATMSMMKKALHMGIRDTERAARIFLEDLPFVITMITFYQSYQLHGLIDLVSRRVLMPHYCAIFRIVSFKRVSL